MPGPTRSPLLALVLLFAVSPRAALADGVIVRGAVVDPHGAVVPGALVRLDAPAAVGRETRTSETGAFEFDAVPPGRVSIRAFVAGFQADPVHLDTVGATDPLPVRVTLRVSALSDSVVVSAAAVDTPTSSVPASTTVFLDEDLRRTQAETATDALRAVPGLGIASSGSRGSVTSAFPRGGESDFTLVLFDGVRLNGFGGGFDFAHVPVAGLERVEVIRGPQSALFGADAVGGVVQLVSRRGGPPAGSVVVEGGGYDTRRATAEVSGGRAGWFGHASGQYQDSHGLDGETTRGGETVINDDYLARHATAGGGLRYGAGEIRGVAHVTSSARGNPGPFGADPNGTFGGLDAISRGTTDQRTAGASWQHSLASAVRLKADTSYADLNSGYVSPYGDSLTDSRRSTVRGQIDWPASERISFSAGTEWMRERADNTFVLGPDARLVPVRRQSLGSFAEARYDAGGRVFVAGGLRAERLTRDELAGDPNAFAPRPPFDAETIVSWNPKVAVSWYVRPPANSPGTWTRVRVNAGTGIRPPDVFEIAFTDNPNLAPERSRSVDAGVEQALADGRLVFDATWFANRYDDLIVAVGGSLTGASRYRTDNISNARARGLEMSGRLRTPGGVLLRAGYTYLDTEILEADGTSGAPAPYSVGDPLIRRPSHQGFVDVSVAREHFDAFARVNARGDWLDIDPTYGAFGGTLPAPGFAVVDLGGSWRPFAASGTAVFARVLNLLDRDYEEVLGYPALGRSLVAGVRVAAGR